MSELRTNKFWWRGNELQRRKRAKVILTVLGFLLLLGGVSITYVSQGTGVEEFDTYDTSSTTADFDGGIIHGASLIPSGKINGALAGQICRGSTKVIETVDGGFVLIGSTDLTKTNVHGIMEWRQTYGDAWSHTIIAGIQSADGGFALAGMTTKGLEYSDFWLVKTDAHGNLEWQQTYGQARSDEARSIIQTLDGGFALAGYTRSFASPGYWPRDFLLVKTDAHGNLEWQQTYGGTGVEEACSMIQTADGGFVLAGRYEDKALLVKTNATGKMEWQQTYGGNDDVWARAVIQTVDGGFALTGRIQLAGSRRIEVWLMKTDVTGKMEWQQFYGGPDQDDGYSVIQTVDGGFALVGSWSHDDAWLVKTDALGVVEWDRIYSGGGVNSIIQTVDGGFILACSTWLVKTNALGELQWKQGDTPIVSEWFTVDTTPPELSAPVDLVYEEGMTGQVLVWMVEDRFPYFYELYQNGERVAAGVWTNETIAWNVEGLPPGRYQFKLVVWDAVRNHALDMVWVNISTTTVPDLSAPEDITYEDGTTGHVITWAIKDRHPDTYTICVNSVQVVDGEWTNGTIVWNVDDLAPNSYNVTLVAWDAAHNQVFDTVWVTVMAPVTTTQTPVTTTQIPVTTSQAPVTTSLPELPKPHILWLLSQGALVSLGVSRKRLLASNKA